MKSARDGVVVPMAAHLDEIVLRTRDLSLLAEDGSGTSWDPIKVEGVAAEDLAGVAPPTRPRPRPTARSRVGIRPSPR